MSLFQRLVKYEKVTVSATRLVFYSNRQVYKCNDWKKQCKVNTYIMVNSFNIIFQHWRVSNMLLILVSTFTKLFLVNFRVVNDHIKGKRSIVFYQMDRLKHSVNVMCPKFKKKKATSLIFEAIWIIYYHIHLAPFRTCSTYSTWCVALQPSYSKIERVGGPF